MVQAENQSLYGYNQNQMTFTREPRRFLAAEHHQKLVAKNSQLKNKENFEIFNSGKSAPNSFQLHVV